MKILHQLFEISGGRMNFYTRLTAVFWLTLLLAPASTIALPQFSLLTGNKCLNCHVNAQGAGLRGELGWYMSKDIKLFSAHSVGLSFLESAESNSILNGNLTFGLDMRFQTTRSPRSDDAKRAYFPMQWAMHAAYQPSQWLTFEGMIELGAFARQLGNRPTLYPGQQGWNASVLIQPSYELPQLRIGHFQPNIGIRYDDHTILARQVTGPASIPLIPPNFAEFGAELNYDGLQWLTLSVGAYLPKSLAQMTTNNNEPLLKHVMPDASFSELLKSPSTLARIVFWPRTDDHVFNSYLGASVLNNQTFTLTNVFAGLGLTDRLSLMGEYAMSGVKDGRQTRNYSVELMWQSLVGLLPFVRYEHGKTIISVPGGTKELYNKQISLGAQIFPLPFVEIRPEYRIFDTNDYTSSRWNVHLHIFY